ncbi:MAG: TRAP transporter substrate-binding protein [Succinivibrio sp.]|nr:TRAP transporter substrate-binding protein [Succinivibrio sp.]
MRHIQLLTVVAGFLSLSFNCTSQALPISTDDPLKVRVAYYRSYDKAQVELIKQGYSTLKERSGGKLLLSFFRNNKLGADPDLTRAIIKGEKIDAGLVQIQHLLQYDKRFAVLNAPYLFDDYDIAHKAMDKYILGWMNELLEPHNLIVLGIFDVGFRHVTSFGSKISKAQNLAGKLIRIPPLQHLERTFKALGAKITQLNIDDYLDRLRGGKSYELGEENTLPAISYYEMYCYHNQLSLTKHIFDFQPFVINRKFFNSLRTDQKKVLKETILLGQEKNRELTMDSEKKFLNELKRHGMKVTHPDLRTFVSLMKPVYAKIDAIAGQGEMFKLQYHISKLHFGL